MGKKEKFLVAGFVAALAATSGVAHYYVTKEGYSMVAKRAEQRREEKDAKRKQRRNDATRERALNTEQQPPRATPGGVWGNMARRRDALGKD